MSEKTRQVQLQPRTPQELEKLYLTLMAWLMDHPEYQYAETDGGVLVVIPPLKVVDKQNIVVPKKNIETLP